MYEDLVNDVRDLKRQSRIRRDSGDYEGAEKLLRKAIDLLKPPAQMMVDTLPPDIAVSEDYRDLAKELADCWGSLGGIHRRRAESLRNPDSEQARMEFDAALEAYKAGRKLEQDDRFRAKDSYNLVQSVVLPLILSPHRFDDEPYKRNLQEVERSIQRQIATSRPNDPWAYSDLGLIQLLLGDEVSSNESWDYMDELKPKQNIYTSGLPVLQSLSRTLPAVKP